MEPTSEESSQAKARLDKANQVVAESEQAKEIAPFVHQCPAHEFAKLLATFRPGSEAYHLTTLAWQQQMTDRQIAAARAANWRSIVGGIIAVLIGLVAGRWLSPEAGKPQIINMSGVESAQAQSKAASQTGQQQPVAAPPPKQATPAVTPTNQLSTPNP